MNKTALMRKTIDQLLSGILMNSNTKTFLEKCQPSYGNILKNEKRESEEDPEFVGFARLPDGTAVRIEGITKTTAKAAIMPIRIVTLPPSMFDGKSKGTNISVDNPSFF